MSKIATPSNIIWAENGSNFRTQYKSIQNLQTLQGYIFRILQHFSTKLCNSTHFGMLFLKLVYNGNCLFQDTSSRLRN
jgi:hypothetical protein